MFLDLRYPVFFLFVRERKRKIIKEICSFCSLAIIAIILDTFATYNIFDSSIAYYSFIVAFIYIYVSLWIIVNY